VDTQKARIMNLFIELMHEKLHCHVCYIAGYDFCFHFFNLYCFIAAIAICSLKISSL